LTRVSIRRQGEHDSWWIISVDDLDFGSRWRRWRLISPLNAYAQWRTDRGRRAWLSLSATLEPWPPRIWRFLRARIRPALDRCLVD
jgi:hypothetical protein